MAREREFEAKRDEIYADDSRSWEKKLKTVRALWLRKESEIRKIREEQHG